VIDFQAGIPKMALVALREVILPVVNRMSPACFDQSLQFLGSPAVSLDPCGLR
jgi:hypothetical protein